MLKYISNNTISSLMIPFASANKWVEEGFLIKNECFLPPKTSITFNNDQFFNTMPIVIPKLSVMGVKLVSRFPNRIPTIDGHILLYDLNTGNIECILEAGYITALRTGSVCATAVKYLSQNNSEISIIGLGATATMALHCILANNPNNKMHIKLFKYKNQHIIFANKFNIYHNVSFSYVDNMEEFISNSDIIISCITYAESLLTDPAWFKKGALLIPVHTKGYQNCDLVFDKIIADDINHIKHFKYFTKFKYVEELSKIITKETNPIKDGDRIIAYNIGIALHDIIFAKKILELTEKNELYCNYNA